MEQYVVPFTMYSKPYESFETQYTLPIAIPLNSMFDILSRFWLGFGRIENWSISLAFSLVDAYASALHEGEARIRLAQYPGQSGTFGYYTRMYCPRTEPASFEVFRAQYHMHVFSPVTEDERTTSTTVEGIRLSRTRGGFRSIRRDRMDWEVSEKRISVGMVSVDFPQMPYCRCVRLTDFSDDVGRGLQRIPALMKCASATEMVIFQNMVSTSILQWRNEWLKLIGMINEAVDVKVADELHIISCLCCRD